MKYRMILMLCLLIMFPSMGVLSLRWYRDVYKNVGLIRSFEVNMWVKDLIFNQEGQLLIGGDTIQIWDATTYTPLFTLPEASSPAAMSLQGRYIATAYRSIDMTHTIAIWDRQTGRLITHLAGHAEAITALAFSEDGTFLASGSNERDTTVRIWRMSDMSQLHVLTGHTDGVNALSFSPDSQTLASSGFDQTMLLWQTSDGRRLQSFEQRAAVSHSLAWSPDGQSIITGGDSLYPTLRDVRSGRIIWKFVGHTDEITQVSYSPDGQYVASVAGSYGSANVFGDDPSVRVWREHDGQAAAIYHRALLPFSDIPRSTAIAFSPDSTFVVSGDAVGTASFWPVP